MKTADSILKFILFFLLMGPLTILFYTGCYNCPEKIEVWKTERIVSRIKLWNKNNKSYETAKDSSKLVKEDFKFTLLVEGEYAYNFSLPFVISSTASQPCDADYVINEKVESLNIFTVNDFNSAYKAGDTINKIVLMEDSSYLYWKLHVLELLSPYRPYQRYLHFNEFPTLNTWQKIRFELRIDGKVFETETPVFWLY